MLDNSVCPVSKMACVYGLLSLYLFHRYHFVITLPWAWDKWRNYQNIHSNWCPSDTRKVIIQLIHQAQSQFSLSFPSTCQARVNIPTLIDKETKIYINLRMCSSIDWLDSGGIASWHPSGSGQIEVGVSMHDHIARYLMGVGSENYQQNACFGVSPKIVALPVPSGLLDCQILLLQTNNLLWLGDG